MVVLPDFDSLVEDYMSLPDIPEPDTFRERFSNAPWDLTDTQAGFVVEHRYDVAQIRRERRKEADEPPTAHATWLDVYLRLGVQSSEAWTEHHQARLDAGSTT